MCYSVLYKAKLKELKAMLDVDIEAEFLEQSGIRIFPRNKTQVIIKEKSEQASKIKEMTYSLVPSWSKEPTVKWSSYNARLNRTNPKSGQEEKIFNAATWKEPFEKFHCVVPLTSFFESCREHGIAKGYEVAFSEKDEATLFAAGIYSHWRGTHKNEQLEFDSFAIITTEPTDFINSVGHDRMPVFLDVQNTNIWLENSFTNPNTAYEFLSTQKTTPEFKFEKVRALKGAQQ